VLIKIELHVLQSWAAAVPTEDYFVFAVLSRDTRFLFICQLPKENFTMANFAIRKAELTPAADLASVALPATNIQRPEWHEIAHNGALLAKNEACRFTLGVKIIQHLSALITFPADPTRLMLSAKSFHWSDACGVMRAPKNWNRSRISSEKWCRKCGSCWAN
jgi:hypothetical protein